MESVVVTGGEPTIHKELPKFLKRLKEKLFAVKLDTNGFDSQVLEECLGYVDYVALDVKTSLEKYHLLGAKDTTQLLRTIEILKTGKVEYEFRTTLVPKFVEEEDVHQMCEFIKGAKAFTFQQFVPEDTLDSNLKELKPYPRETIIKFAETVKKYVDNIVFRI